jgi:sterol desaturase/sphingolipid hydroxylase (fatty acid hydroxylase superfamily)
MDALLAQAVPWYLAALVGGFALAALAETWWPWRPMHGPLAQRWSLNLGLHVCNQGLFALLLPIGLVGGALLARDQGWGLLNLLGLEGVGAILLSVLALDLARYLVHLAAHRVGWLWRLHRVHHSDDAYDCTLALRFHPLEALLTAGSMILLVMALGLSPLGVLMLDVAAITLGFFAHGNLALPHHLETALGRVLVTPAIHRLHHSADPRQARANLASVFSFWDRLFGTAMAPQAGRDAHLVFGLASPSPQSFIALLCMPWRAPSAPPTHARMHATQSGKPSRLPT